jgi:hypothetical protein
MSTGRSQVKRAQRSSICGHLATQGFDIGWLDAKHTVYWLAQRVRAPIGRACYECMHQQRIACVTDVRECGGFDMADVPDRRSLATVEQRRGMADDLAHDEVVIPKATGNFGRLGR